MFGFYLITVRSLSHNHSMLIWCIVLFVLLMAHKGLLICRYNLHWVPSNERIFIDHILPIVVKCNNHQKQFGLESHYTKIWIIFNQKWSDAFNFFSSIKLYYSSVGISLGLIVPYFIIFAFCVHLALWLILSWTLN